MAAQSQKREYLKLLRNNQNVTQKDIAALCGMSKSAYCMIENGVLERDMKFSTLEKLAVAYHLTPEQILHLEQDYRDQRDSA